MTEALAQLNTDHIDILVCNAALVDMDTHIPVLDLTSEQFQTQVMANAWAPLSISKEVIRVSKLTCGLICTWLLFSCDHSFFSLGWLTIPLLPLAHASWWTDHHAQLWELKIGCE